MQSESTHESNLFQLSERALHGRANEEDVVAFAARLCAQPLFVRVMRDPENPESVSLCIVHLSDEDEDEDEDRAYVVAATSRELVALLPGENAEENQDNNVVGITGKELLGLARQGRINAFIVTSESEDQEIVIPHHTLELLAKIALLTDDHAPYVRPSDTAVRAAYPTAFARWLYDYCLSQPDIREARLSLARMGNDPQTDVILSLQAGAAYTHTDRITTESRRLLAPGQVLYTEDRIADIAGDSQLIQNIQQQPALYSKSHSQGWWSRVMRRLKPAPLVFINVAMLDDEPPK